MSDAEILRDLSDKCMRAVRSYFCHVITLSMCFHCLLTSMLLDIVARECLDFMNNK